MERLLRLIKQNGINFTFLDDNDSESGSRVVISIQEENDDAATIGYNQLYKIMSKEEFEDLVDGSTISYDSTRRAVVVTSDSKTIRFPIGTYWTSTRSETDPTKAWAVTFNTNGTYSFFEDDRCNGHYIRAVIPDRQAAAGTYIAGKMVRWYTLNLGSTSTNGSGSISVAWGETEAKDSYSWSNYKYSSSDGSVMTKYNLTDNITILENGELYETNATAYFDPKNNVIKLVDDNGQEHLMPLGSTSGSSSSEDGNTIVVINSMPTLSSSTTYVIKDDVTLSSNLNIPSDVVFDFQGGSIDCSNKTVSLNNVVLTGNPKLKVKDATLNGRLGNDIVWLKWFDVDNTISYSVDNSVVTNKVINIVPISKKLVVDDMYAIGSSIQINYPLFIAGVGEYETGYANYTNGCCCGFYITNPIDAIAIKDGGNLGLVGISLVGFPTLFTSSGIGGNGSYSVTVNIKGTNLTKSITINSSNNEFSGIKGCSNNKSSSIQLVDKCFITGFMAGISSYASCIGSIIHTSVTCSKYGLWSMYTSDFDVIDCHFNSSCKGYDHSGITSVSSIKDVSCAVYLYGVGMVKFQGCKFEFNFSGIYMDAYCNDIKIDCCDFDEQTIGNIIFNAFDNNGISSNFPSFSAITITGCTFLRGVQRRADDDSGDQVLGVAHFIVSRVPFAGGSNESHNVYLAFAGCSISDNMVNIGEKIENHQPYIFYIENYYNDNMIIDCAACNFGDSDSSLVGMHPSSDAGAIIKFVGSTLPSQGIGNTMSTVITDGNSGGSGDTFRELTNEEMNAAWN